MRRTVHPLSLGLLALCLVSEVLFVRQYDRVRSVLGVYETLVGRPSGLMGLIASLGAVLPALLILLSAVLIAREFWITDARRTIIVNAAVAVLLLVLPFLILAAAQASLQGVLQQLGG